MSTPIIQLLDDNSINKIAAGEVIERPASVVKELVENSLDAGAKRIEVEIEAGGVGLIRVMDDGCGMDEPDVRLAVLRHATSKIRSSDDLAEVMSLGFRGEALPSIASVSRFTLISRREGRELGARIDLEGGLLLDVVESGAEIGTVVSVSNLFFNTPVRLKFMKTAAAESSHIHEVMVKLALSRPDVTFRLRSNGRASLHTPGTGRLADVLLALYGPDTLRELFPVSYTEGDIRITGYAARPSLRKGSRQWQSFTVNRRVIGSRMLNRAVDTAYQTLLPVGTHPLVALQIEAPPAHVDVNVHPQKAEVKFQDERSLFKALHAALKEKLTTPDTPAATAAAFDHSVYRPQYQNSYVQESLPIRDAVMDDVPRTQVTVDAAHNFESLKSQSEFRDVAVQEEKYGLTPVIIEEPARYGLKALAQFGKCYILASDGESLYIVDQHAAHERLLFDQLAKKQSSTSFQTLLIPLVLDLDPLEVHAAETFSEELARLGFSFDWMGPSAIRISELPVHIPADEAAGLLRQFLSSVLALKTPDAETFRQIWIETAACHMAVRAGQNLNMPQMQALLDEMGQSERPYTCPHGRPTTIRFSENDLARLFKRI